MNDGSVTRIPRAPLRRSFRAAFGNHAPSSALFSPFQAERLEFNRVFYLSRTKEISANLPQLIIEFGHVCTFNRPILLATEVSRE